MTRMPRWLAVATALSVALLAACGDDDSATDESTSETAADETTTTEDDTSAMDESDGSGAATSAELTAAGTQLTLGEVANVPIDYAGEQGVVGLTVERIDAGTPEDLAALELEGGETGDLYYVTMTIENTGSPEDLGSYMPSTSNVYALQADGQPASPVAKFTAFAPCENEDPSELPVGESFTTCEIYLAQSGVAVTSLAFAADLDAEPIIWK
jgi:hypothetical protein